LLLSERQRRRSRQSIAPQGLDQTGN